MPTNELQDTYSVPQQLQNGYDVDVRFAEILRNNPERAALEAEIVAAYDAASDNEPTAKPNEQIGSFALDTARSESHQPHTHGDVLALRGEHLSPVQIAARATAAVVKMRDDYTLGA